MTIQEIKTLRLYGVRVPAGDFGYDTDSRKARKFWKRCLKFSKKLRAFFTTEELAQLAEIQ